MLLLCDRPNWAYDAIARALVKHNDDPELELEIAYVKGGDGLRRAARGADLVFAIGWQVLAELDPEAGTLRRTLTWLDPADTITGIHSHHAWDGRRTTPERSVPPPPALVEFLREFRGVNCVSRRLESVFRAAGLDEVRYTANGVDTELFRPERPIAAEGRLCVGFSGSKKHDWRKGISELIEPAAARAGVELRLAMPVEGHHVPLEQMPRFYNDIDAYVCASTSEGFSLSVLEAAACGRPVISTRVGGSEELIEDGVNGFLVDRDVEAIAAKLELLDRDRALAAELGRATRVAVEERWGWDRRAAAWLDFVRGALHAGARA